MAAAAISGLAFGAGEGARAQDGHSSGTGTTSPEIAKVPAVLI